MDLQTISRVLDIGDPLSLLQKKRIWKMLKRDNITPNSVVSAGEVMVFLVARVLWQTKLMTDDQFWLLLDEAKDMLQEAGKRIALGDKGITQLVFADRRYVTWAGIDGWLDLHEFVPAINIPAPIESTAYNLHSIARDGLKLIKLNEKLLAMECENDAK